MPALTLNSITSIFSRKIRDIYTVFFASCLLVSANVYSQDLHEGFLPVSVINWKAILKHRGVELSWMTTVENNLTHFIIERSLTGSNYEEIATLPASGNTNVLQKYLYADKLQPRASGVIYYRLKSTDVSGTVKRSDVIMIRTNTAVTQELLSVYPNPAINDVTVNVPVKWQGRKVVYEVYNGYGTMVKKVLNPSSLATETMPLTNLPAGLYMVKASADAESAIIRLMKL